MPSTAIIERGLSFPTPEDTAWGAVEVMTFDSVIREAHSFEIAITDNPVETGVSMTDHAYAKQDKLVMEVVVSDSPLLRDGRGTPAIQLAKAQGLQFVGNLRRSVNAWQSILQKAKSFAVFSVITGLRRYENMMFETGSAEQTKDSAGVMRATINLRQVTFAGTKTVAYQTRGKVAKQAAKKKDLGKKDAVETPAAVKPRAKSLAVQMGLPGR